MPGDSSLARAIAKEAFIYGFPLVEGYRAQYAFFVDKTTPAYLSPFNTLYNSARLSDPNDTTVVFPNSDTPYSLLGADLRAEPLVLTVPAIQDDRYYSLQLIDAYAHNFAYIGTRTKGNAGGTYLLAGPGWTGTTPPGVDEVITCETDLAFVLYRTELFGPDDLDNVKKVQQGYRVEPLSAYLGQQPPPAPPTNWITALTPEEKTSPRFFEVLDFILRNFAPAVSSETQLRARFATLGIGGPDPLNIDEWSPEIRSAVLAGIDDAWSEFTTFKTEKYDTGIVPIGHFFGTRAELNDNYLYRFAGAVIGLWGHSPIEAIYIGVSNDSEGRPLNGSDNYLYRFPPAQLPPSNSFWSLTMYKVSDSQLVANPINRYLINVAMLPDLITDPDGGLTINLSNQSPGPAREANWLPTPAEPFIMFIRIYLPKSEVADGTWKAPAPEKV